MKRILILAAIVLFAFGCHAQVPPNPTVLQCPVSTGTNYTPLNSTAPVTGLTYSDTPSAGSYCYIAQSEDNTVTPPAVSNPSNTALVTVTASQKVSLTWSAPTTGPAPTGYVLSRALAIQSTLAAPVLGNATAAVLVKPDGTSPMLTAKVERVK